MEEEEEDEDERREAAIASKIPSLSSSDWNHKTKLKQTQLAKFQELHRRRLQLKAKPKPKKTSKGMLDRFGKSQGNVPIGEACIDEGVTQVVEDFSVSSSRGSNIRHDDSLQQNNVPKEMGSKKRRKLHWGLDTKERWERKSNM